MFCVCFSGGIQAGDVIIKISGKDVDSANDVYAAVETNQDLGVTVRRGGETVLLTIKPEVVN